MRQEVKEGFETMKQMLLSEMSLLNGRGTEGDHTRGQTEGNGGRPESLSVSNA